MDKERTPTIEVEEMNLEDLILLGTDKLTTISVEYFNEDNEFIKTKAKIKQLTMKEIKNIDLSKIKLEIAVKILKKCLFQNDGTAFTEDMVLDLPFGVAIAITRKIFEISGVAPEDMGF